MRTAPIREVAIYAPSAGAFYDEADVQPEKGGGGAELQTTLIARALAAAGLRTAHIVFALSAPAPLPDNLDVVERRPYGGGGLRGRLREIAAIWRALAEAN